MKSIKLACIITLAVFTSQAFSQTGQQPGDKINGLYWSPKKDAKIEIFKKGNRYFGKSVWVAVPRKDNQNPDKDLKKRELLGAELLTDFSYSDGTYTEGKIYDPESGKLYDCKITMIGDNLKVRGYVGISLFGRTEIFERIK
ncbi:MAG: DUF2147 domain-containing protein [Bacteroidota bacterium]